MSSLNIFSERVSEWRFLLEFYSCHVLCHKIYDEEKFRLVVSWKTSSSHSQLFKLHEFVTFVMQMQWQHISTLPQINNFSFLTRIVHVMTTRGWKPEAHLHDVELHLFALTSLPINFIKIHFSNFPLEICCIFNKFQLTFFLCLRFGDACNKF